MAEKTIPIIEARARAFVDLYDDATLYRILRAHYPSDFDHFSAKRIGVYERAALIVLDVREGYRPSSAFGWSKGELEKRLDRIRNPDSFRNEEDSAKRARETASGTKLDPSWNTTPIRLR